MAVETLRRDGGFDRFPSDAQEALALELAEWFPCVGVQRAVPLGTLDVVLTVHEECDQDGEPGAELDAFLVNTAGRVTPLSPVEAVQRKGVAQRASLR